jgi:hypothetical protein
MAMSTRPMAPVETRKAPRAPIGTAPHQMSTGARKRAASDGAGAGSLVFK